ncbi:hypothetical protein [Curtobacterium ammoniigenes]|uniref:hypothetical protein n=1 Tax=Curtobacterium ammoniigenes TaxID=395387 RepID=UPI000834FB19|nr:hypothetical protein [Curtobacterium ammoniigenes]
MGVIGTRHRASRLRETAARLGGTGALVMVGVLALSGCTAPAASQTAGANGRSDHAEAAAATASPSPSGAALSDSTTGSVDPVARAAANAWITSAVLPPNAVRSTEQADTPDDAPPPPICTHMAHAKAYWSLPTMSPDAAIAWLKTHPSPGLMVTFSSDQGGFGTVADQDEQSATSTVNSLLFTVVRVGSGTGIRADAYRLGTDSVCPSNPGGAAFGYGG